MAVYQEQERVCREMNYKKGLQECLHNQADMYRERGDLDQAIACYNDSQQICRELQNIKALQANLAKQAQILLERQEYKQAMPLLREEEQICRDLDDKTNLQTCLGNQAIALKLQGDVEAAMNIFKDIEQIFREMGNTGGIAASLINQALILAEDFDRPDEAKSLAEEAYRLAKEGGITSLVEKIKSVLEFISSRTAKKNLDSARSGLDDEKKKAIKLVEKNANIAARIVAAIQARDENEFKAILASKTQCQYCYDQFVLVEGLRQEKENGTPGMKLVIRCPNCTKIIFSIA